MSDYNIPVIVSDNPNPIVMQVAVQGDIGFSMGEQSIVVEKDYDRLRNKPQINSVELVGNKFLQDLFQDGILINCGDAQGVS